MIVGSHEDTVELRGALRKNEWLTIKALAKLMLQTHPQGILIDCTELTEVTADGSKTFLAAMHDIRSEGARIVVVNLPENVLEVVRSVPGVRSQLPLAKSIEEARASLRLGKTAAQTDKERASMDKTILVPLIDGLDVEYAVTLAARLGRELKRPVMVAALLAVARNMPMGAPMPEEEGTAHVLLEAAARAAKKQNLQTVQHIERVRDVEEGLLQLIKTSKATHVIVGVYADRVGDDQSLRLLEILFHRAPCNVVVARHAPDDQHPLQASGNRTFNLGEEA
jgi:anti-anti-sigma regulatory factor